MDFFEFYIQCPALKVYRNMCCNLRIELLELRYYYFVMDGVCRSLGCMNFVNASNFSK